MRNSKKSLRRRLQPYRTWVQFFFGLFRMFLKRNSKNSSPYEWNGKNGTPAASKRRDRGSAAHPAGCRQPVAYWHFCTVGKLFLPFQFFSLFFVISLQKKSKWTKNSASAEDDQGHMGREEKGKILYGYGAHMSALSFYVRPRDRGRTTYHHGLPSFK